MLEKNVNEMCSCHPEALFSQLAAGPGGIPHRKAVPGQPDGGRQILSAFDPHPFSQARRINMKDTDDPFCPEHANPQGKHAKPDRPEMESGVSGRKRTFLFLPEWRRQADSFC